MILILTIFSTIYKSGQAICEAQSFNCILGMFWKYFKSPSKTELQLISSLNPLFSPSFSHWRKLSYISVVGNL